MATLLELALIWVGNGITTAIIVIVNDRLFKKRIEKVFDKFESAIKSKMKEKKTVDSRLTCKKCKTKWNYKGKKKHYATCPDCKDSVRIENKIQNVPKGIL